MRALSLTLSAMYAVPSSSTLLSTDVHRQFFMRSYMCWTVSVKMPARSSSVSISFEYGKHDALRTHWFSAEMTRKRQYSGIDVHTNMPRAMSP